MEQTNNNMQIAIIQSEVCNENKNEEDSPNMPTLERRSIQEQVAPTSPSKLNPINVVAIHKGAAQPSLATTAHLQGCQRPDEEPNNTIESNLHSKEININVNVRTAPRQTTECVLLQRVEDKLTWPRMKT